jgi:hypothetical protein
MSSKPFLFDFINSTYVSVLLNITAILTLRRVASILSTPLRSINALPPHLLMQMHLHLQQPFQAMPKR